MVGNGKIKFRVLSRMREFLIKFGAASAREIASFINSGGGRGVTVAQVSNFLAADPRFRKVKSIRIASGVRGGAIWLWELA